MEGYGEGAMTRWYFNKQDRQCIAFIYKGIGGNQVNFKITLAFNTIMLCLE